MMILRLSLARMPELFLFFHPKYTLLLDGRRGKYTLLLDGRRGKAACDRIDKVRYNKVPYFN